MKKVQKFSSRLMAVLLVLGLLLSSLTASALTVGNDETADVPYNTFTYWNHANTNNAVRTRGMYDFKKVYTAADLGVSGFSELSDVSVSKNNELFLLDGGSGTVYVFDQEYHLIRNFKQLNDPATGEAAVDPNTNAPYNYEKAKGITVGPDNLVYICDTNNARLLVADQQGNFVRAIYLPESTLIPSDFTYAPLKVAIDSSNYIYVLSDGSYYGAILYSPDGDFLGFYGANTVTTTVVQALKKLWEKLTMTDEKMANRARELPYQFTDLYVDKADFVYTATGTTKGGVERGQIKRLSPGGTNILDSATETFGMKAGSGLRSGTLYSDMKGLAVNHDNIVYTFDASTGTVFVYDQQNNLLNAFGGGSGVGGKQKGTFQGLVAIDLFTDNEIVLLDSRRSTISSFTLNDYGKLMLQATSLTENGDYAAALPVWEELLTMDRSSQVVYSGIAKAYLSSGEYEKSMQYAKDGFDYKTYSSAFEYVRRASIERNINWFLPVMILVIAALVALHLYKKKKGIHFIKNEELKLLRRVMLHPADVFADVKQKGRGSVLIGVILIALYYVTATIKETHSGFLYRNPSVTSFNSALVLLQTIGIVVLWTVCNWAVCTLFSGKGKMKEIFLVITYSLIPLIISNIVYTICSNFFLASESTFLSIFATIMQLFTAFILIAGTLVVHDYSFGEFVGTGILTVLGILIVIFLMIAVFILVQQMLTFIGTIWRELFYRS